MIALYHVCGSLMDRLEGYKTALCMGCRKVVTLTEPTTEFSQVPLDTRSILELMEQMAGNNRQRDADE